MPGQKPDLKGTFVYTTGDGTLWLLDANGDNKRELYTATDTFADFPAFSPDGKQVAYAAVKVAPDGSTQSDIRVISVESKAIRTIASPSNTKFTLTLPTFGPDGTWVYFTATDLSNPNNPHDELDRVSAYGGEVQIMIDGAREANISTDGKKIAYFRFNPKDYTLSMWVADIDGGNAERVVDDATFEMIGTARFAPDSQSIVFSASGPPLKKLPGVALASPGSCSWGMLLNCFARTVYAHGSPWDLWLVNLDGSKFSRLTNVGADSPAPAWSADNRFIAYFEATGIYAVEREKKLTYKIAPYGGYGGFDWR